MPELPEVEIIKQGIEPLIMGRSIVAVERRHSQPSQHPDGQMYVDQDVLEHVVIGSHVTAVRRRAKVLMIDLSSDLSLLFHLKMTGQVVLDKPGNGKQETANSQRFGGGHPTKSLVQELPDSSTRTIIELNDGTRLYFNDQRKFGWIKVVPTGEINNLKFFQKVGPEPLGDAHTVDNLSKKLQKRTIALKSALLDQSTVAGTGNIYADEALNLAKLSPLRQANSLSKQELIRLHAAIPHVMQASIERGGTSFSNYVNHMGLFGDYLQHARAFNRTGQPCLNCGRPISKIKVNGRGTHYCPHCQK